MKKKTWIKLGVAWVVCSFIIVYISHMFDVKPTVIKTGFNNERVKMLKERYELEIPDTAIFISGYYDNAFRDPSIHITFKVPEKDFHIMFKDNWQSQDLAVWTSSKDKGYNGMYQYNKKEFTAAFYDKPIDGYITIYFIGTYHGN